MATVTLSFIREHAERLRSPRTLWVPFELGRPLGVPNDPAFQRRVIDAAFALLSRPSGPVLEEYPEQAPRSEGEDEMWGCPVALPAPEPGETGADQLVARFRAEVALLRPWFEQARGDRQRTAFGLSGLAPESIDALVETLARFGAGEDVIAPAGVRRPLPSLFRYLADDARTYYLEAATAQPRRVAPDGKALAHWLYRETVLGDVLHRVRDRLAGSDDPDEKRAQGGLIAGALMGLE